MKTRKVTRMTLDELANVMPVLTEEEQKKYLGGDDYKLNNGGQIYLLTITNDNFDKVYSLNGSEFVEIDKGILSLYMNSGVFEGASGTNLMPLYNFVAKHSDVEWSLSQNSSGMMYLRTNGLSGNVDCLIFPGGLIHSHTHPGISDSELAPSEVDLENSKNYPDNTFSVTNGKKTVYYKNGMIL